MLRLDGKPRPKLVTLPRWLVLPRGPLGEFVDVKLVRWALESKLPRVLEAIESELRGRLRKGFVPDMARKADGESARGSGDKLRVEFGDI